jgi:hypothetical protein
MRFSLTMQLQKSLLNILIDPGFAPIGKSLCTFADDLGKSGIGCYPETILLYGFGQRLTDP